MFWSQIFGSRRMSWLLQEIDCESPEKLAPIVKKVLCTTNLATCPDKQLDNLLVILDNFEKNEMGEYVTENYTQKLPIFDLLTVCSIFMGENHLYFFRQRVNENSSQKVWQVVQLLLQMIVPIGKSRIRHKLYQDTIFHCQNIIQNTGDGLKISCCILLIQRILLECERRPFPTMAYNMWSNEQRNKITLSQGGLTLHYMDIKNNYQIPLDK